MLPYTHKHGFIFGSNLLDMLPLRSKVTRYDDDSVCPFCWKIFICLVKTCLIFAKSFLGWCHFTVYGYIFLHGVWTRLYCFPLGINLGKICKMKSCIGTVVTFVAILLQGGSSEQLYKSVHSQARIFYSVFMETLVLSFISPNPSWLCAQIFTLPKDTLIYPAHDYKGFTVRNTVQIMHLFKSVSWLALYAISSFQVSSVGEEMEYNPRLTKDMVTFIVKNIKFFFFFFF